MAASSFYCCKESMPTSVSFSAFSFTTLNVSRCVRSSFSNVAEASAYSSEMPPLKSIYVNKVIPVLKEELKYTHNLQEWVNLRPDATAKTCYWGGRWELHSNQRLLMRDFFGTSQPKCHHTKVIRCSPLSGSYSGAIDEGDTSMQETQSSFPSRIAQFQDAFWRFLRPHTIRGTIIGTTAVVVRALIDNSHLIDWGLLPKALRGLLALLCGNGYIVGINQIYDIGIDKVNKPFLPVAAGDLSIPAAWALVVFLALLGVTIVAANFGPLITGLYLFGLFLGAIYSVPPLRLKRFAVAAFLIIATVRGFLLNFGVYYATRASLGLTFTWSPPIVFITFFVTLFATVIAITKDLPDVEGDRKFQIATFATKLGVRNIAFLGSGLLLLNYVGAIVAAYVFPQVFRKGFMVVGHLLLASALIYQTWLLDASKYSKEAIAVYYRFVWNLFYAEYALLPFI